ncbi:MAG: OB-fold domain-containing protein [Thermoplasmata archaeon]|nr:OB-fold domain-containing protein [Thermoplasmata archaeon]
MKKDVPFVLAMVQLDGTEFRILSRIGNTKYEDCSLGMRVRLETYELEDERSGSGSFLQGETTSDDVCSAVPWNRLS